VEGRAAADCATAIPCRAVGRLCTSLERRRIRRHGMAESGLLISLASATKAFTAIYSARGSGRGPLFRAAEWSATQALRLCAALAALAERGFGDALESTALAGSGCSRGHEPYQRRGHIRRRHASRGRDAKGSSPACASRQQESRPIGLSTGLRPTIVGEPRAENMSVSLSYSATARPKAPNEHASDVVGSSRNERRFRRWRLRSDVNEKRIDAHDLQMRRDSARRLERSAAMARWSR